MAEQTDIQKDLTDLTANIKRLEAEYNMFFAGRLPRPPWETRNRVDAMIKRYDGGQLTSTADRFRFEMLQTRFQKMLEVWDRGMRAREEGRSGPFNPQRSRLARPRGDADSKILHVTALKDPMREMDKVHALYDSLMEARRGLGEDVVPFHRFAALVKDQVSKLRDTGTAEVAFRVAMKDGKVNFTVRGLKGEEKQ
jgi:hypothetical protein